MRVAFAIASNTLAAISFGLWENSVLAGCALLGFLQALLGIVQYYEGRPK